MDAIDSRRHEPEAAPAASPHRRRLPCAAFVLGAPYWTPIRARARVLTRFQSGSYRPRGPGELAYRLACSDAISRMRVELAAAGDGGAVVMNS